jgi:hypothetical protein
MLFISTRHFRRLLSGFIIVTLCGPCGAYGFDITAGKYLLRKLLNGPAPETVCVALTTPELLRTYDGSNAEAIWKKSEPVGSVLREQLPAKLGEAMANGGKIFGFDADEKSYDDLVANFLEVIERNLRKDDSDCGRPRLLGGQIKELRSYGVRDEHPKKLMEVQFATPYPNWTSLNYHGKKVSEEKVEEEFRKGVITFENVIVVIDENNRAIIALEHKIAAAEGKRRDELILEQNALAVRSEIALSINRKANKQLDIRLAQEQAEKNAKQARLFRAAYPSRVRCGICYPDRGFGRWGYYIGGPWNNVNTIPSDTYATEAECDEKRRSDPRCISEQEEMNASVAEQERSISNIVRYPQNSQSRGYIQSPGPTFFSRPVWMPNDSDDWPLGDDGGRAYLKSLWTDPVERQRAWGPD